MPGLDRTGPQGQGPRTGRQMGKCASRETSTEKEQLTENTGKGKGMGRGMGKRLGLGRRLGWQKG